jgi:NTE family protein
MALALLAGAVAAAERPRVGLVLGGGGARGAAHIGVLEVLRENRVQIDCIAGTSMGGLVSGAFAAGLTPEEMMKAMGQANWRDMFNDSPAASEINPRARNISRRYLPGSEVGVNDRGANLLPGVVSGQKIKLFFNKLVRSEYGDPQIEQLNMPTTIVATDLVSGDKVTLREGSLTKAMRASMSVPGLMAPVESGGTLLVDGGLVDNVPIDEVRKSCNPDVVIAVNVGSPLLQAKDIGSLLSVAAQMVNILTEQNVSRSLATLKPTDIYIKPDLEGITAGDFQRYAETAKRGREAALAVVEQLRKLDVGQPHYDQWWASVVPDRSTRPVVDTVEFAGLERVDPNVLMPPYKKHIGQPLDTAKVETDVMRTFGASEFDSVDYSLLTTREKNILRITPLEKAFGPNYLRFGLELESVAGRSANFNLRGAYQKTWINSLGAEWLSTVQIGQEPGIATEFYQPLDKEHRFFVEAAAGYGRKPIGIYQDNKELASYNVDETRLALNAGINVGLLGPLRLGWLERRRDASSETGTLAIEDGSKRFGGWQASMFFDQFDRLYAPTKGWQANGNYFYSPDEGYSRAELDLRAAGRINDVIFLGRLYGAGAPSGDIPAYDTVRLGGFLNMSGFVRGQIIGTSAAYGSIRIEKIIGELPLGLRGDMRLGMALESGRVDGRFTETNLSGWQNNIAFYIGGETPLGPIYAAYGYSPEGSSNVFIYFGTP